MGCVWGFDITAAPLDGSQSATLVAELASTSCFAGGHALPVATTRSVRKTTGAQGSDGP